MLLAVKFVPKVLFPAENTLVSHTPFGLHFFCCSARSFSSTAAV
jgi:hypothetical protein